MLNESWSAGNPGHVAEHNRISKRLNTWRAVVEFPDMQAALDYGGLLYIPPGVHTTAALTISKDVTITGAPGAVLRCNGIRVSGSPYVHATIRNLAIRNRGAGATGLVLDNCIANLEDVDIQGFNEVGLHVTYGMSSRYEGVVCRDSPIGLKVSGSVSTSLTFSRCTFHNASVAAVKVEADVNSIAFTDWTVFQSSAKGLVVDGASVVSLVNPYFENIAGILIDAGSQVTVQSLALYSPIAVGGAANDDSTALFRFDRVQRLGWFGGGDCRVPKASWIETTPNVVAAVIHEPRHLGLDTVLANPTKVIIFRANGRLESHYLQINKWELASSYSWTPGDLVLSNGGKVALYATPAGVVRIAADNNGGVLSGGVEFDGIGIVMRSPDGSRWRYTPNNEGALVGVKV